MKKPELMSPIRDWTSLEACKYYADAVYFGCSDLSLRARSNNIKLNELGLFVSKCHGYGLKAYLTVNSIVYENDLNRAERLIKRAKEAKIDAIIAWDMAVISLAKKHKVNFFVSTQSSVCNSKSALVYKKLGAKRIVLAREMTLKQIKEFKKKVNIEVEAFCHGAMCVAISGRCILSAYLYGNSANCGSCSQPCRKPWILSDSEGNQIINEGKYFMNSKDICMIEYVPDLIKAGIDSFKIEGRARDPRYIKTVTKCYREAIDSFYGKTFTKAKVKKWKKELASVYNRGFCTGFYFGTPSKEGISYNEADNISKVKRTELGRVFHYYSNLKVVSIKLQTRGIKLGDKIIIEGKNTYIELTIKELQIKNKRVERGLKGQEVAFKVPKRARRNDKVFVLSTTRA